MTKRERLNRARARAVGSRKFLNWGRVRVAPGVYKVAVAHMRDSDLAGEQHFTPAQLGKLWALSPETVRIMFENEPGVLIVTKNEAGKRRYRTFRIPQSVASRVHTRMAP